MKLSDDLLWRGLIKDTTFDDKRWLDKPQAFYLGTDTSEDSMTIGNLAVVMLAMRMIKAGWTGVMLLGGGTSLVGDPGGKDTEREMPDIKRIKNNVRAVKAQLHNLLQGEEAIYADNSEWLAQVRLLDFLREVGKQFSMTELVQRDYISERMGSGGSGISYAEFSYSLLQGYDYWQLYKRHKTFLQIGGSDQWGNMLSGVPLIRKKEGETVHAMSMPLVINKVTGRKFGKSEEGAVWLDPSKTPTHDFYQFWVNVEDQNVADYLKVFTFLDKAEIEKIMSHHTARPEERTAQTKLAYEVTTLVHGQSAADEAEAQALALKAGKPSDKTVKVLPGTPLVDILTDHGLAASRSEARRLIDSSGIYANQKPIAKNTLEASDFKDGQLILRRGKKLQHSVILELQD